jgi:hypothetical protein
MVLEGARYHGREREAASWSSSRGGPRRALTTALLAYAVADFAVHTLFASIYGYFRDELYYVVAGTQHLSLGYVDFSPLLEYIAVVVNAYGGSIVQAVNGGVASGETGPLPQNIGDRLGWDTMVSTPAHAYDALPANEGSRACMITSNYGEASAVNFLGRSMGLPEAISGHNSYYIGGPDSCAGHVLMAIGFSMAAAQQAYANVTLLTTITCKYCIDLENNLPVHLCTNPTFSSPSRKSGRW